MKELAKRVTIQKQKAYRYKEHFIYKFRLNIPSEMIKELGWSEDSFEVLLRLKDEKIVVSKPPQTLNQIQSK